MKKNLFMAAMIAFCIFTSGAGADTIILAADVWCPFNCEPESDRPGYIVEVAKKVFAEKGHTVTYKVLPWARAIDTARKGNCTGIIGAYREDAPDFVFPENELGMVGFSVFTTKKTGWQYKGIDSLKHISLGVINDYAYNKELDDYILNNMHESNLIQIASGENPLERNILKLIHGRIDALMEAESVLWYTAAQMKEKEKLRSAGVAETPKEAYIAFSPAIPASRTYAKILSDGVAKLRASGELAKILEKYGLEDWR